MNPSNRALRMGLSAVLCAAVFRLWSSGLPQRLGAWLTQSEGAAFLIYLETGRDVRFSPSSEVFSPNFMESPPPAADAAEEAALPVFSDPEAVELYYGAGVDPDVAALLARPLTWELRSEEPTVLILHTHATESYTQTDEDYVQSSAWRTLDEGYNMLSIGAEVAEILEEAGIRTVHDGTLHDYPSYNGSYNRARKTIRSRLEEAPGIRLVLDLHRDASEGAGGQLRTLATSQGQTCAQLMLVVGTNHEAYEENLSLALKLHAQLEAQCPGITRPLQLRTARFNQDLSAGALLVEVGAAGNTHDEALLAARELAQAIAALAGGTGEAAG